jgi:dienelactone hydrolase
MHRAAARKAKGTTRQATPKNLHLIFIRTAHSSKSNIVEAEPLSTLDGKEIAASSTLPASCTIKEQATQLMNIGPSFTFIHRGTRSRHSGILAAMLVAAMPLHPQISKREARAWQEKIRAALFVPAVLPPLDAKSYVSFSPAPGVVAERVSYTTEYGLRIPAIVYRPEHVRGKIPGIVVVNGHGADKSSWYSWYTGVLYASAGAAVLTYDPIGEGERNDDHKDGTGEHDRVIDVPGVPQRMGGLMVTDVMQGVSFLRSMKEVDPNRIGVMGFSMGSFITSIAGAVDDRIHAVLLTGGGDLDGPGDYWDSSHAVMCQSGPYHALEFLGDRGAAIFTLQARRGATFIINGTNDTVVAIPEHGPGFFDDLRKRTIAMNGSAKNVFETYFDPGASHRPAWVTKLAVAWLGSKLHFANWNADRIAALPTIRIGDWAAKNSVYLSKSSMREDRDAGLAAIDVNVPKLTPEQLSVLPMDEWQRQRTEFVYSAWASAAIADAKRSEPTPPVSTLPTQSSPIPSSPDHP